MVAGAVVVYDLTFSEDMNGATIDPSDFSNAGTSTVTIGTIVQVSPSVYQVRANALTTGTLRLQVDAGAVLADLAGNTLVTSAAILDDTTLTVMPENVAPTWSSSPVNEANASEDAAYTATLADNASDADSDPLAFAKVSGPAWLNVAADGALSGTPGQADVGSNAFTVSVSDNIAAPVEVTLNITVVNTNDSPFFTANPITAAAATEDAAYTGSLAGTATDVDPGASLAFAKVSGPAWLSVAPDGTLSGTPSDADVGANAFTISVSDGIAAAVTATLNITVTNTNDAPVFTANPLTGDGATEDVAYSATLAGSATDDDDDTLVYGKVSGPAWLLVATDGTLSGTPGVADAGENIFTVSVTDGNSTPIQATLNITVNAPPGAYLLAYEGFDYPVGELLGLNGGTGFATGWADSNGTSNQGYVRDETTNVFFDNTTLNWDGVLNNGFPTSPNTGSRYISSDAQVSSNVDVKRALAASAGAMAGADGVLWMSAVYRFPNGGSGASINFGFTDGGNLTDRGRRTSSMTMDFIGVSGWNGSTTWNQQVNPTIIDSTTATNTVWNQYARTPAA